MRPRGPHTRRSRRERQRQNVLAKNKEAFVGRPSNPFGSGAPIQWRALGKLTDFEVPRHLLGKLTDFEVPRHLLQYNII